MPERSRWGGRGILPPTKWVSRLGVLLWASPYAGAALTAAFPTMHPRTRQLILTIVGMAVAVLILFRVLAPAEGQETSIGRALIVLGIVVVLTLVSPRRR